MDLGEGKSYWGRAGNCGWRENCGLDVMYCLREEFIFNKKEKLLSSMRGELKIIIWQ